MWGALSPTKELPSPPPIVDTKKTDMEPEKIEYSSTPKRSIGQAEIESAYFKVCPIDVPTL